MDLRLFMTLVRFDAVYVVYFKTNVGTIEHDYPNLLEYCRDVYQMPGVAKAGTGAGNDEDADPSAKGPLCCVCCLSPAGLDRPRRSTCATSRCTISRRTQI